MTSQSGAPAIKPKTRRALVHLGAHRTGTSSLQKILRERQGELEARNVFYQRGHEHQNLRKLVIESRKIIQGGQSNEPLRPILTHIHQEFEALKKDASDKDLLYSYEGFLGDVFLDMREGIYPNAGVMLKMLGEVFGEYDTTYLVTLRSYGEFIDSCYRYSVRWGFHKSFDVYMKGWRTGLEKNNWITLVQSIKEHCGGNFKIFFYEDFKLRPFLIYDALVDALPQLQDVSFKYEEKENVSAGDVCSNVCRVVNNVVLRKKEIPYEHRLSLVNELNTTLERKAFMRGSRVVGFGFDMAPLTELYESHRAILKEEFSQQTQA